MYSLIASIYYSVELMLGFNTYPNFTYFQA